MATEANRRSPVAAYAQTKGGRIPTRIPIPFDLELVRDLLDENGVLLVDADPDAPSTFDGDAR